MQCFISTNQAQDKALCMFVRSLTCFMSSFFWFHLWISVMLSELDEIAAGFSLLCLAYALLWEEPELNEGADLCQRLSVNALGQRWTHTHTHTHTNAQPLVCFSAVKGSHLGLNSYENVSLVLCFQDVSAVTGTTHMCMCRY